MQTPPPTPPPTVAPGAPRRPLLIKRSKTTTPALSAEDKAALMPQLKAIRAKHAPRVLELTRVALDALNALEQLEDAMDEEARALYPSYVRDIQDYKLTFQHDYPQRAEEYDDAAPFLEQAVDVIADMRKEAEATTTTTMAHLVDTAVVAPADA
jgi:hypothetical protein